VTDEVKVTEPRLPAGETIFFATEDGELSRTDPQMRIPGVDVVGVGRSESA
jgi:hypothetical protein